MNFDDTTNGALIEHVTDTAEARTPLEIALTERLQFACDELDRMTQMLRLAEARQEASP